MCIKSKLPVPKKIKKITIRNLTFNYFEYKEGKHIFQLKEIHFKEITKLILKIRNIKIDKERLTYSYFDLIRGFYSTIVNFRLKETIGEEFKIIEYLIINYKDLEKKFSEYKNIYIIHGDLNMVG